MMWRVVACLLAAALCSVPAVAGPIQIEALGTPFGLGGYVPNTVLNDGVTVDPDWLTGNPYGTSPHAIATYICCPFPDTATTFGYTFSQPYPIDGFAISQKYSGETAGQVSAIKYGKVTFSDGSSLPLNLALDYGLQTVSFPAVLSTSIAITAWDYYRFQGLNWGIVELQVFDTPLNQPVPAVPEPSTLLLLISGVTGAAGFLRKYRA